MTRRLLQSFRSAAAFWFAFTSGGDPVRVGAAMAGRPARAYPHCRQRRVEQLLRLLVARYPRVLLRQEVGVHRRHHRVRPALEAESGGHARGIAPPRLDGAAASSAEKLPLGAVQRPHKPHARISGRALPAALQAPREAPRVAVQDPGGQTLGMGAVRETQPAHLHTMACVCVRRHNAEQRRRNGAQAPVPGSHHILIDAGRCSKLPYQQDCAHAGKQPSVYLSGSFLS